MLIFSNNPGTFFPSNLQICFSDRMANRDSTINITKAGVSPQAMIQDLTGRFLGSTWKLMLHNPR